MAFVVQPQFSDLLDQKLGALDSAGRQFLFGDFFRAHEIVEGALSLVVGRIVHRIEFLFGNLLPVVPFVALSESLGGRKSALRVKIVLPGFLIRLLVV